MQSIVGSSAMATLSSGSSSFRGKKEKYEEGSPVELQKPVTGRRPALQATFTRRTAE